jgi:ABC-type transport system involved in multi-copper enzyme maturation permease subunit
MKTCYWNRALAWKEWRQNNSKIWVLGVFMSGTPIIGTVFFFIFRAIAIHFSYDNPIFYNPAHWSANIAQMLNFPEGTSMGTFAVLVALGLGALGIAQERPENTLEFLVTTPVSRREIAATKFLVGIGGLLGIMAVNFLFISGMALILPANYTIMDAFTWFVLETVVLLALFGLGFLVAVVTGNILGSLLGALIVPFCPVAITGTLWYLSETIGVFPRGTEHAAFTIFTNIGQYLTLPHYIINYHDFVLQAAFLVPALLLATLLFFFISIALFERNPLERSGQLLVFGDTRKVIRVVVSLIFAVIVTSAVAESFTTLRGFTLLLVLLGAYFLCSGFMKWMWGQAKV